MSTPIAELIQISQTFSGKKVLNNLSLAFPQKKTTALLGYSGSGKSTILKMINGMVRPDSGSAEVFGKRFDYENAPAIRLNIGYVVQHTGLFPHMTVEENVGLLGKISRMKEADIAERTRYLMDTVQLPESYLTKYPYQLSGGEQQRVGLCRAFFLKPPLVLMDEPFASLDYKTKGSIYEYLLDLQTRETTSIIFVTHQLEEADILADEIVWIDAGKVRYQGSKTLLSAIQYEFKEKQ
jgi:osmoprotectant transport system ATP-binding protein